MGEGEGEIGAWSRRQGGGGVWPASEEARRPFLLERPGQTPVAALHAIFHQPEQKTPRIQMLFNICNVDLSPDTQGLLALNGNTGVIPVIPVIPVYMQTAHYHSCVFGVLACSC